VIDASFVLRWASGACVAATLFCFAYAGASAPTGEPARYGLRGLKRKRALAENALWAQLEPIARWVGRRVRPWISESRARSLDAQIECAGDYFGWVPEEVVALSLLGAAAYGVVGAIVGRLTGFGDLITMMGAGYGLVAPHLAISDAAADRLKAIGRRLPSAIDLLALGMSAGLDFPAAVRQVIEKAGHSADPMIEELTLVLRSLQVGQTRSQALQGFARRAPCDAAVEFVGAVVQAELRGTPVANVLQMQAEISRQRRTVRAEEAATKAGVKLMGPLVLVFACVLLLVVAPMVLSLRQSSM
jgi:tight adherence protein C